MLAKALLSASVSAPPAVYVEDVFSTFLYTSASTPQTINNGIDLAGEGGLIWEKTRGISYDHQLVDTVRGLNDALASNSTSASVFGGVRTALSNGYIQSAWTPGNTIASWTFRKAAKFFDVVTFTTAPGSYSATVNHSLGSTPGCIIVKCTTTGGTDWNVWHRSLASDKGLWLQSTAAQNTQGTNWITSNSTSFSANASLPLDNATYVAYLFAHDAGGFGTAGTDSVVSCGTFTTDGSGNLGTVNLGWEPQWILAKKSNSAAPWHMFDTMRGMSLTSQAALYAHAADAELTYSSSSYIYPTSNGFAGSGNYFGVSSTIIYIAIRRGPMKTPTVGTEVFSAVAQSGDSAGYSTGFAIDAVWDFLRAGNSYNTAIIDRLRGTNTLTTSSTAAENAGFTARWFDRSDGANPISLFGGGGSVGLLNFRRAPGFFDVVCSSGFSDGTPITHNLKATPELILVKARNNVSAWMGAISEAGNIRNLSINTTSGGYLPGLVYSSYFNSTTIDPAGIKNGAGGSSKGSGVDIVAYLFATAPGVSKVGSYTGTGTTKQIDCGFTAGARFVMIKRTDNTGDWYVWDTARGIVSGNDPYLWLNTTDAEVTNTDYIDPLSSGFEISSTAPAAINANGGTYIFLAIA